ncbi:MAG TPA: sigma-70 family RNA polymerase sigma factor [Thermomicrobiales bacterium]|nr:sigma-70 family RNA polymerase sigma factor [Thermomicrobiales bacterium]
MAQTDGSHLVSESIPANPDEALVQRARAGDSHAFDELYQRYQREIRAFLINRVRGDLAMAEDLTSEVFTKLFRFLDQYRAGSSFRGWLYQIARNTAIDHARRARITTSLDDAGTIASPVEALDEQAIAAESREALLRALAVLPPGPRRIVELRLKGFGPNEIAAELGMELSAVKSAQHRAFRKLRAELHDFMSDREMTS